MTTVTVGGPPAGARTIKRVCVLRGTSAWDWTPAFPGRRISPSKQADHEGLHRAVRPHTLWANRAVRLSQALYMEARADDRDVVLLELDGGVQVHVYDGRGRLVDDITGGPVDEDVARTLARSEWHRLREDQETQPWRWQVTG